MKEKLLLLLCYLCMLLTSFEATAQKDSLEAKVPKERPTVMEMPMQAALLAAVLPGAGQVYNKKYWKVPIVIAGAAGFAYAIKFNHDGYIEFRNGLIINTDGNADTNNAFPLNTYSNSALLRIRDSYRKNRDLTIILSILFYGLTITDAAVDAHLADFDVSPDLSIAPTLIPVYAQTQRAAWGMSVKLRF